MKYFDRRFDILKSTWQENSIYKIESQGQSNIFCKDVQIHALWNYNFLPFYNWCFILVMIVCMFYILKIWKWQIPLVWLEPDFWTFQQKKSRINAFKSFKDYPFPGKVANLKILFRQRYLSAAPWWCKRSHWIFVKGPTLLIGMAFIFGKVSWKNNIINMTK